MSLIDLTSSDVTQGTVSPAKLTFTSTNALAPQTVTVTGVDDAIVDETQVFTILTSATQSADAGYNGLSVNDVSVSSVDDGRRPYQNLVTFMTSTMTTKSLRSMLC